MFNGSFYLAIILCLLFRQTPNPQILPMPFIMIPCRDRDRFPTSLVQLFELSQIVTFLPIVGEGFQLVVLVIDFMMCLVVLVFVVKFDPSVIDLLPSMIVNIDDMQTITIRIIVDNIYIVEYNRKYGNICFTFLIFVAIFPLPNHIELRTDLCDACMKTFNK
ncbi:hypothetical protein BLOT_011317 [Blomia tropicalis]|nr:hypothetical protein BLOT_011317 [Blomia tropicalis]